MRPRSMIVRTLKIAAQALVLVVIAGWFVFGGVPNLVLISQKEGIVAEFEKSGIDVSECKRRKLSLTDPSAGMPSCLEGSFKDIQRKMERQIERSEGVYDELESEE